jgi:hypothetical protein
VVVGSCSRAVHGRALVVGKRVHSCLRLGGGGAGAWRRVIHLAISCVRGVNCGLVLACDANHSWFPVLYLLIEDFCACMSSYPIVSMLCCLYKWQLLSCILFGTVMV